MRPTSLIEFQLAHLMGRPYEVLRGKKPNLGHLRTFGCVCYAKTDTAGRKKFDDRSRTLVHLGTEPGSKAYRLVDPISKKVLVNRDVVFDETKSRNWDEEIPRQETNSDTFTIRVKGLDDNEAIETQVANENEGIFQNDEVEEESDSETEENLALMPNIESHNRSLNKKSFSYSIIQTHK